jgi:hypothetical protein
MGDEPAPDPGDVTPPDPGDGSSSGISEATTRGCGVAKGDRSVKSSTTCNGPVRMTCLSNQTTGDTLSAVRTRESTSWSRTGSMSRRSNPGLIPPIGPG